MENKISITVRLPQSVHNMIKKECKDKKLTMTDAVTTAILEHFIQAPSVDDFLTFKGEVTSLLIELSKQARFSSSVCATLYSQLKPDTVDKLKKIHDEIFKSEGDKK